MNEIQTMIYFVSTHLVVAYILYRVLFVDYVNNTFYENIDYLNINIIKKFFFTWISPLITLSEHKTINMESIYLNDYNRFMFITRCRKY